MTGCMIPHTHLSYPIHMYPTSFFLSVFTRSFSLSKKTAAYYENSRIQATRRQVSMQQYSKKTILIESSNIVNT